MADQPYNFLSGGNPLKGMGAIEATRIIKQDPQWRLNVSLKQQQLEMNRAQLHDMAAKREMAVKRQRSIQQVNELIASGGFTPDNEIKFLRIASQNGWDSDEMNVYLKRFESSREAAEKADMLEKTLGALGGTGDSDYKRNYSIGPNGVTVNMSEREKDDIQRAFEYQDKADKYRELGDVENVRRYQRMADAYGKKAAPRGGMTMTVKNPDGTEVNIGEQPQGSILDQPLAPGTLRSTQETLAGSALAMDLLDKAETFLKPEYFGVRGLAGETLIDRAAAQIPGMEKFADQDRIEARTFLKSMGEAMLKSMSADSGGRLSDYDVRRVKEFTDVMTASTSFEQAKGQMRALREFVKIRAIVAADISGARLPLSMMEEDDFIEMFDKQAEILKGKRDNVELTEDEFRIAIDELATYIESMKQSKE
jgi:hypothetical protein